MADKLAATVVLRNPETGMPESFEPGSEPPEWALPLITNPEAWGRHPEPEKQRASDSPPSPDVVTPQTLTPPPKGGPGSSVEAWNSFASQRGVVVPAGSTREDIIAACEATGVSTDH